MAPPEFVVTTPFPIHEVDMNTTNNSSSAGEECTLTSAPAEPPPAAGAIDAPPTLNKKDLNKLLNDFARACAFGDDLLARMAASKAIHEYLDAAFAALASPQAAPPAAGAAQVVGWNALTDEDRDRAFRSMPDMLDGFMKTWGWLHFAKAIEDICREKNSALTATPSPEVAEQQGNEDAAIRAANHERDLSAQAWATLRPPMTRIAGVSPGVLERAALASRAAPIDMVLFCPACGMQHIDAPEKPPLVCDGPPRLTPPWINPPHRSHLCHGCGHIWRPADVPTNGVAALKTKGKNDSPIASSAAPQASGKVMRSGAVEVCAECDIADCRHIRERRAALKASGDDETKGGV